MMIRKAAMLISALAMLSCAQNGGDATMQYMPVNDGKNKVVDSDNAFDPRADILFVIDNSGSMSSHQANLANNIGLFTSTFMQKSVLNWQIGVITTDRGALVGTTKIVKKTMNNADQILANNIRVGISGDGVERPFAATLEALSPGLLAGVNKDFVRDESALIVIFITDAEDQSGIAPSAVMDFILNLKLGDKRKVLAFGAIIPTANLMPSCGRDDSLTPVRIEQFLASASNAPNNVLNLCEPQFGKTLAEFANEIVERTSLTIYLTRLPDPDTIKVTFGGDPLPNDPHTGWTYDVGRNAIQLGKNIDWEAQPPRSEIRVSYGKAKIPDPEPAP